MAHTLFTIDVWDTILRRRCHPDEVKLYVARAALLAYWPHIREQYRTPTALLHLRQQCEHEIGSEAVGLGRDDEYRLEDVLVRWARYFLADARPGDVEHIAAWARSIELAQEHAVCEADPGIEHVLAGVNGARRVALSDFYLSRGDLASLIEAKAPGVKLDDVVVSCDVGLNKRSGRLFRYIQDEARVAPSQHAHIGDHPAVDVATPAAMGIHAVQYLPAEEERTRAIHRERWARRAAPWTLTHALRRDIADNVRAPDDLTTDQKELFYFGARCAPLYAGLVLRAIEEAGRRGVGRVHYFTREGTFFRRVHHAIERAAPGSSLLGVPLPGAEIIEVSRISTFCASLREVSTREMMRVWNLYSTQSIRGLLASLAIDEITVRPVLEIHGIDPSEQIQYPWLDARVQSLFADRRFTGTVERAVRRSRRILTAYLASRGFVDDGSPKVIVDIGWRGTIQDNISFVHPGSSIVGIYLGMHGVLNEQPRNAVKVAYACDAAADPQVSGLLLEHVQPLEVLANSSEGSVAGYEDQDGTIVAVRREDGGESGVWHEATRHFQNGVIAAIPAIVRWIRTYAFSASDLQPMAVEAVRDIMSMPPESLCRAFFRLSHNETFGLGQFVEMKAEDPASLARRMDRDPAAHEAFWKAVWKSNWPGAFLKLHGLEQQRLLLARTRYGHVPLVDPLSVDPQHAAWSLGNIESSRLYRVIRGFKRSFPLSLVNRLRFGAGWDVERGSEVERLRRITSGRTFRFMNWCRHNAVARRRAIERCGMDALDRW